MVLARDVARRSTTVPANSAVVEITPDSFLQWLRRRRFALTLTFVLISLGIVTQQVISSGPLVSLDYRVHYLRFDLRFPQVYDPMYYLVMLGQRGPTAIPGILLVAVIAGYRRSWRPLLVLGGSLLVLNVVVGVAKVYTARLKPADGSAAVFVNGGIIFPSGHASNVVVTWGLVAYLLVAYGPLTRHRAGIVVTTLASLVVGVTSIYLDTHWITDILAGWLVGIAIVMIAVALDRRYPAYAPKHRAPTTPRRTEPERDYAGAVR